MIRSCAGCAAEVRDADLLVKRAGAVDRRGVFVDPDEQPARPASTGRAAATSPMT